MIGDFQEPLEVCKASRQSDPDRTIQVGETQILQLEKNDPVDYQLRAKFRYYIGNAYFYKRNLKASVESYQLGLTDAEQAGDALLFADIKISIADISRAWGNYLSAIDGLEQARNLQVLYKSENLAFTLHKLGICQHNLSKHESARKTLFSAVDHCSAHPRLKIHVLTSLAMVCMDLSNHLEDAEIYLEEALSISKTFNDVLGEANSTCELGQLCGKQGKFKKGIQLCNQAESLFLENGFKNYTAECNLYKGEMLARSKLGADGIIQAESAFQKALMISALYGPKSNEAKAHEKLASFYASRSKEKQAFFHFKEFHRIECGIREAESESRMEYLGIIHKVEEEQQKQAAEKARNAILEQTNRELKTLLDERKKLMGVAAHDLKNPISGIVGLVDYLKEHPDIQQYEEIPAIIELLDLSASSALQIVTNILEDHRLEEGRVKLSIRKNNLNKLCEDVCKLHKTKAEAKQIKLDCRFQPKPVFARVDRFSIKQALDNLISNAIKFCSADDEVIICVHPTNDRSCQIQVIDTGPGISETDQRKLFKRFAKLSNKPTSNESSSGLGLAIAKKLVTLNNGDITFSSKQGQGTTFSVQLPKAD